MIKKEDLIQIIQAAFSPLECVAELKNYGHGIGFCVYLPDIDNVIFEENNAENLTNVRRQLPCPVGDNYLDRLTDM